MSGHIQSRHVRLGMVAIAWAMWAIVLPTTVNLTLDLSIRYPLRLVGLRDGNGGLLAIRII